MLSTLLVMWWVQSWFADRKIARWERPGNDEISWSKWQFLHRPFFASLFIVHMRLQDSGVFINCGGNYHHRNDIVFWKGVVQESNNHERNNDSNLAEEEASIVVWVPMSDGNHSMWMFLRKPDSLGFRILWLNPEVGRIPTFIIECFRVVTVNRHNLVSIKVKTREKIDWNADRVLDTYTARQPFLSWKVCESLSPTFFRRR